MPIPSELTHCSAIVFCSTRTTVGSADGHLVSGRRDTHQLLLLSCAHDDARGYPIGFGVLVLDLVRDVRKRGQEGPEKADPGRTIHVRVPVEMELKVGGLQARDRTEV